MHSERRWRERRVIPAQHGDVDRAARQRHSGRRDQGLCHAPASAPRSPRPCAAGIGRPTASMRRSKTSGISQYEFRWGHTKKDYFDAVAQAFADQKHVFDRSFDPMARLVDVFASCWPTPLALAQDDFGPYFAGIIRFASSGIDLHADYAPFNMPGYAVSGLDAQIAWNLFVEAPASGGVTTVHNAPWTPEIESGAPPKSYGLAPESVAGCGTFTYRAGCWRRGSLQRPAIRHKVSPGEPADGHGRLQIGSFIGRIAGDLVLFT